MSKGSTKSHVFFRSLIPLNYPTQAATAIGATTATGNGNITDLGSPPPTQHGVCWNTTGTPTIGDGKTKQGPVRTTGAFHV